MIHHRTRTGATLTEVLVAIFVMAIGLLALLTLFPLGALSMAQAIKDNRTAHSGKNAFAIAEAYSSGVAGSTGSGIHSDVNVLNSSTIPGVTVFPGAAVAPPVPQNSSSYFLNPYPGNPQPAQTPPAAAQTPFLAPDLLPHYSLPPSAPQPQANPYLTGYFGVPYDGPSYPIFVDPIGWRYFGSTVLGNVPSPGSPGGASSIPRQPLSGLLTAPSANQWLTRWCTLSDDITFNEDGSPSSNTGAVQRENRYTWAWLLRRPKFSDPTVVDVTVVVYSGRSSTSLGETAFVAAFDPTSKFVDITYSGTKPSIRTGSWILDATMEYYDIRVNPLVNPVGAPVNVPDPHGFFYRVVGVTDVNSTTLRLELQT